MAEPQQANPAVVGLAGFGFTTLILQFHNLGWSGVGPVVSLGLVFGGLAQLIAGFQEFKTGNNFAMSAFCSFGSFWISLGFIFLFNHFGIYAASDTDLGFYLLGWTLYTGIMFIGAMRLHGAFAVVFLTLTIGFALLTAARFGHPALTKAAAIDLIICALAAWYTMASIIFAQVFGRPVLPVGKPWI